MGAMTIPSSILQRCMPFERYIIIKILFQKWPTGREKKSLHFFFPPPRLFACVFLQAQTPNEDLKVPTDHQQHATCFEICTPKRNTWCGGGGGREDIQETCPKETSKGQWSTTKRISSICFVQQDVANAFSLTLRGEQEKGCTWGKIP